MNTLTIHNVIDIEVQEIRRTKLGKTIWRSIVIKSEDRDRTEITFFARESKDLILRHQ